MTSALRLAAAALGAWMLSLSGAIDVAAPQEVPVVEEREGEEQTVGAHVSDLAWLEGSWIGSDGESDWESVYTGGRGNVIVGASKELKGERCVMSDFEYFYERDGALRMTPYPFGTKSVEFTLTSYDSAARRAVFENPDHDFPHTFVYHRVGDERLTISLAGAMGGEDVRFTLDLHPAPR